MHENKTDGSTKGSERPDQTPAARAKRERQGRPPEWRRSYSTCGGVWECVECQELQSLFSSWQFWTCKGLEDTEYVEGFVFRTAITLSRLRFGTLDHDGLKKNIHIQINTMVPWHSTTVSSGRLVECRSVGVRSTFFPIRNNVNVLRWF